MIKFFFYLIIFGILFLIFNQLFDVKVGRWYMHFSLKEHIITGITGETIKSKAGEKLKDFLTEHQKHWQYPRVEKERTQKGRVGETEHGREKSNSEKGDTQDTHPKEKEGDILSRDGSTQSKPSPKGDIDPIENIIRRNF